MCKRQYQPKRGINEFEIDLVTSPQKSSPIVQTPLLSGFVTSPQKSKSIEDPNPLIECELMDGREPFLNLARENHYQFDTVRTAKWATTMFSWHLFNDSIGESGPGQFHCNLCEVRFDSWHGHLFFVTFFVHCNLCEVRFDSWHGHCFAYSFLCRMLRLDDGWNAPKNGGCFHAYVDVTFRRDIQTAMTAVDVRYHCLTCYDFDMCTECHKTRGHEHELAKFNDLLDLTVRVRNPALLLLYIIFPPALLHQEWQAFLFFGRAAQDCQVPNALFNIEMTGISP
jgi:hypothetical protein